MKPKTLFDHLKAITQRDYDPNYWKNLSESDKKTFSSYMIHRFISMNYDWTEIANIFQRYSYGLSDELVYKLYATTIPKGNIFLRYIKGKNEVKYDKDLVDIICRYFEISKREAYDYIEIFSNNPEQLIEILEMYGIEPKKVKKMMKSIGEKSVNSRSTRKSTIR